MMSRQMIDPWDPIPATVQSVLLVDSVDSERHVIAAAHRPQPGAAWQVTGQGNTVSDDGLKAISVCLLVTNRFTEVPA